MDALLAVAVMIGLVIWICSVIGNRNSTKARNESGDVDIFPMDSDSSDSHGHHPHHGDVSHHTDVSHAGFDAGHGGFDGGHH